MDSNNTATAISSDSERDALHCFFARYILESDTNDKKQEIRRQFYAFKRQLHKFQASSLIWHNQQDPELFWSQAATIALE